MGRAGQVSSHCGSGTSHRRWLNAVGLPQPGSFGTAGSWSPRAPAGSLVTAGEPGQGAGTRRCCLQPSCRPLQAAEGSTLGDAGQA